MNKLSKIAPAKPDLAGILSPDSGRSEEMEAVWRYIQEEDAKLPDTTGMSMAEQRRVFGSRSMRWNQNLPDMAEERRLTVPGPSEAPEIACELVTPADARPGCAIYLHGGGWAFGSIDSHKRIPRTLAAALRLRVLSVEYRLAPENPFPAGLNDCVATWRWLAAESRNAPEFNGPLVLCGDSAGANLAVATMLHEVRSGRSSPDGVRPSAGLLFYGVYNCDFDSPSYQRFGAGYGLSRAGMENMLDMYAPGGNGPDALRYDPLVSPALAPEALLARLPPLFLNAAGLDPLVCDTLGFSERLEEAGVPHEVHVHPGVHHGFMQITERLSEARHAYQLATTFLDKIAD